MMWKKPTLGLLWALLPLIFLLAACGGEDEPTPTPTASLIPPTAPPTVVSPVLPTATVTPAVAVSPLQPSTATITSAQAAGAAMSTTGVVSPPVALDCPIQPDLDIAGYPALNELGCPLEVAVFDAVGINEFGTELEPDRFMLWLSNEKQIYVLLPDGAYAVYPDTWTEEQPTFTCNPLGGPEESPPLPRRGFGKVWCTVDGLAAIMGPVPREERLCQHTVMQRFEDGRLLACYEDATIRYIHLRDDQTWETILTR